MIDALYNGGLNLVAASWWATLVWPVLWILIKIVAILAPLMGAVAYLTLWERKLLGFMQQTCCHVAFLGRERWSSNEVSQQFSDCCARRFGF